MAQRYVTGVDVFDTFSGQFGTIVQMNLMSPPITNPYTVLYEGQWIIVQLKDSSLQLFTEAGRMVNHSTGAVTVGVTLLTLREYNGAMAQGYPQS